MHSVTTPSGAKLDVDGLSKAEAAVRSIALNNSLMLEHNYETTREDVDALVELARMKWYELQRKGK